MNVTDVATICHEANRALCFSQGDCSQMPWELAPEWQKKSAIAGVEFHLKNPDAKPSQAHENWMKDKLEAGWTWGKVKNEYMKEHPCLMPYDELPDEQRCKDHLFKGIVEALKTFINW